MTIYALASSPEREAANSAAEQPRSSDDMARATNRIKRGRFHVFGAGLIEGLEYRCSFCPNRHLLAARCSLAEHELEPIPAHAQGVRAIDQDLVGEITETFHGCLRRRPRYAEHNNL